jgi:hypothetical protein
VTSTQSPLASRFATSNSSLRESIEDPSQEDAEFDIPSTEPADHEVAPYSNSGDSNYDNDHRSPKRRRRLSSTSDSPPVVTHQDDEPSSLQTLSSPLSPARNQPPTGPRFLYPSQIPRAVVPTSDAEQASNFHRPPRFLPAESAGQGPGDPLPEAFSPRRRGRKYLADGLAAKVRGWIFDLEAREGVVEREAWKVRFVVDEVSGHVGGVLLVGGRRVRDDGMEDEKEDGKEDVEIEEREEQANSDEPTNLDRPDIRMVLSGEGIISGIGRGNTVKVGSTVGVRGVMWDVDIQRERWSVGVEWKVL